MTKEQKIALGLKEDATEAECLEAIKTLNKAKTDAENAVADIKAKAKATDPAEDEEEEGEEEEEKPSSKKVKNLEKKLAALQNQVEEKNKKDAALEKEAKKNAAKAKILETASNRGLKLEAAAVDNYVALATVSDDSLDTTIKAIESIPVTNKAPKPPVDLSDKFKDETGIPLIPTEGTDEKGHPKAGDTSKVVDAINSFDYRKYNARKR